MELNCKVNIVDALMGKGKAQELTSLVLTENGYTEMRNIHVGSKVYGEDGELHNVIGVYPQGVKDVYKVEFSDGTDTTCCKEHLWTYQKPQDKAKEYFRTNTLEEIMNMDLYKETKRGDKNWQIHIPITKPVNFKGTILPLSPYLLGFLIGDGCFRENIVSFSNTEDDLICKVKGLLRDFDANLIIKKKKGYNVDYSISKADISKKHSLVKVLNELGLMSHRSYEKFIPDIYKTASIEDRISILQGLIDTDGCINKSQIEYSTSSEQLANDIVFIVQSLGGTATKTIKTKTTYIYKNEKRIGRSCYRLHIKMPDNILIYSSEKHKKNAGKKNTQPYRTIRKISFYRKSECQCILVDNPSHLYLTNDFIVTHNTQSIMNKINQSDDSEKFLVITPFLDEIERYKSYCSEKNFKSPKFKDGQTKLDNIKRLLNTGENIVSTHALFQKFDNELIDICRANNYTLIMDEVANVIEEYKLSKEDFITLTDTYCDIDEETKQLIWKEEYKNYFGKFDNEKRLCELGSLVCYGDGLMVWLFPIEVFNAFRNIYILTYKFSAQLQKYYYDYYGLKYEWWSATGDSLDNYHIIPYEDADRSSDLDYSKLIHICENEKINLIGDRKTDLSVTWYRNNKNNSSMKALKRNLCSFFRYIRNDASSDNIWTTFKDYKNALKGAGYTKGFLAVNARATNEYRDRTSVAYPVNIFLNPFVKNFFTTNNIKVDEEGYALSEMLQFIWRSAIRDGKEIWVYIPSIRMRNLLKQWINENSQISEEK